MTRVRSGTRACSDGLGRIRRSHGSSTRASAAGSRFQEIRSWPSTTRHVDEAGVRCTVWGAPAHPSIGRKDLTPWLASEVADGRFERLEELIGPFAVILDDPRRESVLVATDPLGVFPLFAHETPEEVLIATDAWEVVRALDAPPAIETRAVASWLWFGFDCSALSLFEGVIRLPAGCVIEVGRSSLRRHSYVDLLSSAAEPLPRSLSQDALAGTILDCVRGATAALLENRSDAVIALSGGWDSRLLAACAVEAGSRPLAVSVANAEGDEVVAEKVARRLGLELHVIRSDGDVFDLYSEPFGQAASGFPITRFITDEIARRFPGRPMLNGYLGDSLIRGSHDRIGGELESAHSGSAVDIEMRAQSMVGALHLLESTVAEAARRTARISVEEAVAVGSPYERVFQWVDLAIRQRYYIPNNFLLHRDLTEALLPFYDVRLIRLKLMQGSVGFGSDLYRTILRTVDPALADMDRPAVGSRSPGGVPRSVRRMALANLGYLLGSSGGGPLQRGKTLVRMVAALAGRKGMEDYVKYVQGIALLESQTASLDPELEWDL